MIEYTCAMTITKLVTTDGIMSHGVYYESAYKMIITKDLHSTEQSSTSYSISIVQIHFNMNHEFSHLY